MREALESRKTIDMALGILIATHHCTPEEAFAVLSAPRRRTTASCATLPELWWTPSLNRSTPEAGGGFLRRPAAS